MTKKKYDRDEIADYNMIKIGSIEIYSKTRPLKELYNYARKLMKEHKELASKPEYFPEMFG